MGRFKLFTDILLVVWTRTYLRVVPRISRIITFGFRDAVIHFSWELCRRQVSHNRILVETDSPYTCPQTVSFIQTDLL